MCDLFKTLCPEFVDHRWEYLYDALEWAVPREKALQFLKLHDFSSPAAKEDENQHQLSAKHLELLQELGHENKRSCRFWAIAGLCRILAHWGHNVTGYLHGCLCHQGKVAQEPSKKRSEKKILSICADWRRRPDRNVQWQDEWELPLRVATTNVPFRTYKELLFLVMSNKPCTN